MTDSLHQMGFTNSDSTPDKEGVVGKAGIFDDTLSGGVSKVVAVADYQVVKGIFRMKAGADSGKGRRRILLIGKEGVESTGEPELMDLTSNIRVFWAWV